MPAPKNGKKINGKKINGTDMGKLIDPDSSDAHPDVVRFMQTIAWVKKRHEEETKPKLEQLRQHQEVMAVHREETKQRTENIHSLLNSDDEDDPVIHVLDLFDPVSE